MADSMQKNISCGCCCSTDNHESDDHDHGHSHDHGAGGWKEYTVIGVSLGIFLILMAASDWIESVFGTRVQQIAYLVLYGVCGWSVLLTAFRLTLRGDLFNEFSLMSVATIAAICLGELPEAVGVMLFYRIGEEVQEKAAAGSRQSVAKLLASKPTVAHVLENGTPVTRQVEDVPVGAQVQVLAGEKIPLDGRVVQGESQVDQSPLTGESVPVVCRQGDTVFGGTINISGVLTIEVTSVFAGTHMAKILTMVEHAVANKSKTERFITRFARYYTPLVVALAVLVACVPPLLFSGELFSVWIYRALVMLVISCPCALLISVPLGYFGGIGAASRHGILVKGGTVFDNLPQVTTVIFDKTGTLTRGSFTVTHILPANGVEKDDLMQACLFAEQFSTHPIARSVQAYAKEHDLRLPPAFQQHGTVQEVPGKGLRLEHENERYLAGTALLLQEHGITVPEVPFPGAVVHVARGDSYLGVVVVSDTIKPDAQQAVQELKQQGLATYMLTGDREASAAWVAKETGIDGYRSNLLPDGKVRALQEIADGSRVAFVGDGINDAPVLALSQVGIAMGKVGAEAAIEAADVVILHDSPGKVATLFTLGKSVRAIVWQNIVFALGVKTLVMALGIAGLSGLWEAVFADVGVALLAVLNATRVMRH